MELNECILEKELGGGGYTNRGGGMVKECRCTRVDLH